MKQNRININSKSISYYETKDDGNVVIFVHGTSSASSIFIRQLIDSVLSYQYRFIALDLIGYGNSDASPNPDEDYSLKGLSRFLVSFCNHLDIINAVFVGHDIGGNVILEAYNELNNPKGLVLLGSVPFSNPFNDNVFADKSSIELLSKAGIDSSEVHQTARLFVEEGTQYPDFIPEIIRKSDLKTREVLFQSIFKGDYSDQIQIFNAIKEPLALYSGEFDQIINNSVLKSLNLQHVWKNAIHEIRDSGHMFFYDCPADFNVSIEAYLNTVFK